MRIEWDGGSFEFGADDVVYLPAGHTYRSAVIGDEPVRVFYVMSPAPGWRSCVSSLRRPWPGFSGPADSPE